VCVDCRGAETLFCTGSRDGVSRGVHAAVHPIPPFLPDALFWKPIAVFVMCSCCCRLFYRLQAAAQETTPQPQQQQQQAAVCCSAFLPGCGVADRTLSEGCHVLLPALLHLQKQ
jgi:hypothetical protein